MWDGLARGMEGDGRLCGEDGAGVGVGNRDQHGGLAGLHWVRMDERKEVFRLGDSLRCVLRQAGGR